MHLIAVDGLFETKLSGSFAKCLLYTTALMNRVWIVGFSDNHFGHWSKSPSDHSEVHYVVRVNNLAQDKHGPL